MSTKLSRRMFLGGTAALSAAPSMAAGPAGSNERITVGMIAVGSRAQELLEAIKQIDGTEIVGVCDAYKGRTERAVSRTGGRAKVYAVTIATPDHWHKTQVIEALEAGKDVYCEKPLTYTIADGLEIAAAVKKSGRLLQVGSQGISSKIQEKAREIIASGRLGQVTMIRAGYNRNSASGSWIYPIPPDASPRTVDWEKFLGPAKKRPFDLERFFRWRCYQEYSGGIATDLFVHLCTTIHFVMEARMPSTLVGRGKLYRWKESRNVPDTLNAIMEYPEGFTVNLSSTFNNRYQSGSSFQIMGTEGTLVMGYRSLEFIPDPGGEDNRWITNAWPVEVARQYYQDEDVRKAELPGTLDSKVTGGSERYQETGRDSTVQHFENFFKSVRKREPTVEDEMRGHRAAACAHLINQSAKEGKVVEWDFSKENRKA